MATAHVREHSVGVRAAFVSFELVVGGSLRFDVCTAVEYVEATDCGVASEKS